MNKPKRPMHHSRYLTALTAVSMFGAAAAHASTVTLGDPQAGGIGYRWTLTMGETDTASLTRHVGAWSWEDEALFNPALGETPVGWTHTSDWIALTLTSPSYFTLRLESVAGVPNPTSQNPDNLAGSNLFPGYSIYTGWDSDLAPQAFADLFNGGDPTHDWHTYDGRGNIAWAEDLTYVVHVQPDGTHLVEQTFLLPAGEYSIVLGGNSTSTVNEPRQGYLASISTVPEAGSASLALVGGLGLLARRRRTHSI